MDKVAVIGFGNISCRHRANLRAILPNVKIYGMSSSGQPLKQEISDVDEIVSDINELIDEKIKLAIIASPASMHSSHAIPLIKSNIPILIEKPITSNSKELLELHKIVKKYNTPIAVGYCLRFLSSSKKIKKLINSKIIGDIYHVKIETGQFLPDWRPGKDYKESVSAQKKLGGGVLLELSHEFDYASWLFGDLSLNHAILSRSNQLGLNVEDCADVVLSSKDGLVVNIHLDFLQSPATRKCRLVGTKGSLEWDLICNKILHITNNDTKVIFNDADWEINDMYVNMLHDFIELTKGKKNSLATVSEASAIVDLIEDIKERFGN